MSAADGQLAAVLLHGQPGSPADWAGVVDCLGDDLKTLVPARPGYGVASRQAVGFAANAAAVLALMDRERIGRAVVAGHSWGAGVALAVALSAPSRVAGLVLVAPASPLAEPTLLDRLLALPLLSEAAAALALVAAAGASTLPGLRSLVERRLPAPALAGVAGRHQRRRAWRSFAVEQRALVRELPTLAPRLATVRAPVVIVCGNSDHLVPPRVAEELGAAIPTASVEPVAGAGHLLPHEQPAAVAAALRRVLGQSLRPTGA